jgi:hypothetical protein
MNILYLFIRKDDRLGDLGRGRESSDDKAENFQQRFIEEDGLGSQNLE